VSAPASEKPMQRANNEFNASGDIETLSATTGSSIAEPAARRHIILN
jgi:hypothetical protein